MFSTIFGADLHELRVSPTIGTEAPEEHALEHDQISGVFEMLRSSLYMMGQRMAPFFTRRGSKTTFLVGCALVSVGLLGACGGGQGPEGIDINFYGPTEVSYLSVREEWRTGSVDGPLFLNHVYPNPGGQPKNLVGGVSIPYNRYYLIYSVYDNADATGPPLRSESTIVDTTRVHYRYVVVDMRD